MPSTNVLANLFVTLYNNEARRNTSCIVLPTSKLGIEVLKTLQKDGYVGEFEHIDDKRGGKWKIKLLAKITKCGAISPILGEAPDVLYKSTVCSIKSVVCFVNSGSRVIRKTRNFIFLCLFSYHRRRYRLRKLCGLYFLL